MSDSDLFEKDEKANKYVKKLDLLIVDDDDDFLNMLVELSQKMGLFRYVVTAKDGSEASSKLNKQAFGVILLDNNLPRKKGVDLLKEIKNSADNYIDSVILISGELDKESFKTAHSFGVKNFLVKPFEPDAFMQKVKTIYQNYAIFSSRIKKKKL